ncbi:hypothetical protein IKG64_00325 [Candidatus Saccharibacteria bacterium]|nr:hypothetical protein [Candidatus Saccharibacteria bacterium]
MKKNAKIIIAAAVVVVAIVGIIAGILIANNGNKDPLIGSWANGSYIYTFNEDGTCSYAYSGAGAMECTYETDGDKISILYTENTVPFETTYRIEGNTLTVVDSFGNDTNYTRK